MAHFNPGFATAANFKKRNMLRRPFINTETPILILNDSMNNSSATDKTLHFNMSCHKKHVTFQTSFNENYHVETRRQEQNHTFEDMSLLKHKTRPHYIITVKQQSCCQNHQNRGSLVVSESLDMNIISSQYVRIRQRKSSKN